MCRGSAKSATKRREIAAMATVLTQGGMWRSEDDASRLR